MSNGDLVWNKDAEERLAQTERCLYIISYTSVLSLPEGCIQQHERKQFLQVFTFIAPPEACKGNKTRSPELS